MREPVTHARVRERWGEFQLLTREKEKRMRGGERKKERERQEEADAASKLEQYGEEKKMLRPHQRVSRILSRYYEPCSLYRDIFNISILD